MVDHPGPNSVAVTGARGFVGKRLIERLVKAGTTTVAIVRPGRDSSGLRAMGATVREADLSEPERYPSAFSGVDALVHLSGMGQLTRLASVLETAGLERGVFIGSTGIYTKLDSESAESKRKGEAALRASSLQYTILRPTMIYGYPDDRNMSRLLRYLMRVPVVLVPGAGRTLQQPVHVDDLVEAIVCALLDPSSALREYDLGGPRPLSLREVIAEAAGGLRRRAVVVPLPLAPSHALVAGLYRIGLRGPVSPEQVQRLAESKAVDITAARRDLGFEPRPFADGIRSEARAVLASQG